MTGRVPPNRNPGAVLMTEIVLLVLAGCILTAGCATDPLATILPWGDRGVYPQIIPAGNAPPPPVPEYRIPFQKTIVSVSIPINGSVYTGAKQANKEITLYGNVPEKEWVASSYRAMIEDPDQEEFYIALLDRLRQVRAQSSLNDDEYLELIAVFVQSIPYETVGENAPKFPIETYADQSGDCDDKSLLLAALLEREGYSVALLSFRPESHMAVGIVCPGTVYRDTGYAYIETTNVSYLGVPPEGLNGGIQVLSNPLVIPVGTGTKVYSVCNQTTFLHGVFIDTGSRFANLSREAETANHEMQALAAARDVVAYNRHIAYYNRLVTGLKKDAEVHNYILNHQYDRKGTYEWVMARLAGP